MSHLSTALPNKRNSPNVSIKSCSNTTRPLRVAINGFGRIGRNVLRALIERDLLFAESLLGQTLDLVAINDIADAATLLHLLKYDSTHGRLTRLGVHATLEATSDSQNAMLCLQLNGQVVQHTHHIRLLHLAEPDQLPWQDLAVDVVLECTGRFRSYAAASQHLIAGARRVVIGAAPFDAVDACVVMGVNEQVLTKEQRIISSVSCTTQALVPLIHTLDKAFTAKSVLMAEIHAVTADQNVLDQPHRDLRRARASGHNIIPTTSSSIGATITTLPHMAGKIDGYSIRVPTIDVAAIDVNFVFAHTPTLDDIIACLKHACQPDSPLSGIMGYTTEPLVSSDFIHRAESLIIDGNQLMQVGEQIKVFAWYDNEWGYANRLVDLCVFLNTCKV